MPFRDRRTLKREREETEVAARVKAGLPPTAVARQLGLGRSTVYREINRAGVERGSQAIEILGSGKILP